MFFWKKKIQGQISVERMGLSFDDYPGFKPQPTPEQRCATQFISQWDEILSEKVYTGRNVIDVVFWTYCRAAGADFKTSMLASG